jgi:hypothetical protein
MSTISYTHNLSPTSAHGNVSASESRPEVDSAKQSSCWIITDLIEKQVDEIRGNRLKYEMQLQQNTLYVITLKRTRKDVYHEQRCFQKMPS